MTTSRTEKFIINLIIFFYKIPSYISFIFINIILFTMIWFLVTLLLVGYINLILIIASAFFEIGPTMNKWLLITCAGFTFIPCLVGLIGTEFKEKFKD